MMKYFFLSIVLAVIGLTVYLSIQEEDHTLYIQEIEDLRKRKDRNFKNEEDSPILEQDRVTFQGLRYYEVNPDLKLAAKLEKNTKMERLTLGSSTGKDITYLVFGYAVFKLDGTRHRLMLLQATGPDKSNQLFLPFSDETSAIETYGAGRYLDLDYDTRSNRIMIDFNRAYSPYCAYNELYTCALPPPENHLSVSIQAGEKN